MSTPSRPWMGHGDSLSTLDAAVHYMHMCVYGVQVLKFPIVCRHVDWSNTVPLLMINLILKAAQKSVG